mmetsp:Transcript_139220/g.388503  ORF Transcript_139220/g.388503 Transcript_139220/m.388503 type:complete len:203 (+) Transcript_139220:276-884(+)
MPKELPSRRRQKSKSTIVPTCSNRQRRYPSVVVVGTLLQKTRRSGLPLPLVPLPTLRLRAGSCEAPSAVGLLSSCTRIRRPSTTAPFSPVMAPSASAASENSQVPMPWEEPSGLLHKSKSTILPWRSNLARKKPSDVSYGTPLKNTIASGLPFPEPFFRSSRSFSFTSIERPSTSQSWSSLTARCAAVAETKNTTPAPMEQP